MTISLPTQVLEVFESLENNGFIVYLVGGAVRDLLMGFEPKDYDLTTNATVNEMLRLFNDYKIIETGLKHDTITIHNKHIEMEITSFRGIRNNLLEDLKLRDYTINSIAYNPKVGIVDNGKGISDIENKVVRLNDNNAELINADPLRILRGIRMSYKYDFNIDETTSEILHDKSRMLLEVSVERIHDELNKIIVCDSVDNAFLQYNSVFETIIPELSIMIGFEQNNPYHIHDVYKHTLEVLKKVKPNKITRLAALFHDIGKPETYTVDEQGIGHFYGHQDKSVEISEEILKRLKYSRRDIENVSHLIKYHDYAVPKDRKGGRKFLSKFGTELLDELFDLKQADILAQNPKHYNRLNNLSDAWKTINTIIEESLCFSIKDLAVNGKDLISLGIPQGVLIKEILNDLLTRIINEEIANTKQEILPYVRITYLN